MLCMLCYVCKDSQTTAYIKYIYADTSCFWLIKMLLPINFNSSVTKQTHTYIYIYIKIESRNSIGKLSFLCCIADIKIAWINPRM